MTVSWRRFRARRSTDNRITLYIFNSVKCSLVVLKEITLYGNKITTEARVVGKTAKKEAVEDRKVAAEVKGAK
jgi:hypothetical protein